MIYLIDLYHHKIMMILYLDHLLKDHNQIQIKIYLQIIKFYLNHLIIHHNNKLVQVKLMQHQIIIIKMMILKQE